MIFAIHYLVYSLYFPKTPRHIAFLLLWYKYCAENQVFVKVSIPLDLLAILPVLSGLVNQALTL